MVSFSGVQLSPLKRVASALKIGFLHETGDKNCAPVKKDSLIKIEVQQQLQRRLMRGPNGQPSLYDAKEGNNLMYLNAAFLDKDGREALVAYLKDQGVKNPIPKQSSMNDGDFVVAIQPNDQRTFLNAVKGQSAQAGVSRESRTVLAKQPR